jgi:hypothetical protein
VAIPLDQRQALMDTAESWHLAGLLDPQLFEAGYPLGDVFATTMYWTKISCDCHSASFHAQYGFREHIFPLLCDSAEYTFALNGPLKTALLFCRCLSKAGHKGVVKIRCCNLNAVLNLLSRRLVHPCSRVGLVREGRREGGTQDPLKLVDGRKRRPRGDAQTDEHRRELLADSLAVVRASV